MSLRVAIVLVHYHTPELAAEAIAALNEDLERSGITAQRIVVDNGSDEAGRALLSGLPVELISPGENLGYARGVNLGAERSDAEALVLMNADVLVLPGAISTLLEQLDRGAACAGPCFLWDRTRRLLLPPTEPRRRLDELVAAFAQGGGGWAQWARRRSRAHSWRHWMSSAPLTSFDLSGSLLAIRRDAWQRVGGFDPAYRLYFEETDWLRRLRRSGLRAAYVPGASAVHLYGQSSLAEPRAAEWFEQSARLFRRRTYGRSFAALLGWFAASANRPTESMPEGGLDVDVSAAIPLPTGRRRASWIEVSPNPAGFPAAAERLRDASAATWTLPAEVARRLAGGSSLWARVCDDAGNELACHRLVKAVAVPPGTGGMTPSVG